MLQADRDQPLNPGLGTLVWFLWWRTLRCGGCIHTCTNQLCQRGNASKFNSTKLNTTGVKTPLDLSGFFFFFLPDLAASDDVFSARLYFCTVQKAILNSQAFGMLLGCFCSMSLGERKKKKRKSEAMLNNECARFSQLDTVYLSTMLCISYTGQASAPARTCSVQFHL